MKIVSITIVALVTLASSGAAFAGKSQFCEAGMPTPQYVCDAIKANEKPKHVVANPSLTTGNSVRANSGTVVRH